MLEDASKPQVKEATPAKEPSDDGFGDFGDFENAGAQD